MDECSYWRSPRWEWSDGPLGWRELSGALSSWETGDLAVELGDALVAGVAGASAYAPRRPMVRRLDAVTRERFVAWLRAAWRLVERERDAATGETFISLAWCPPRCPFGDEVETLRAWGGEELAARELRAMWDPVADFLGLRGVRADGWRGSHHEIVSLAVSFGGAWEPRARLSVRDVVADPWAGLPGSWVVAGGVVSVPWCKWALKRNVQACLGVGKRAWPSRASAERGAERAAELHGGAWATPVQLRRVVGSGMWERWGLLLEAPGWVGVRVHGHIAAVVQVGETCPRCRAVTRGESLCGGSCSIWGGATWV